MGIVKRVDEIADEPHPFLKGVTMKTLLSKRDDGADATCIVARARVDEVSCEDILRSDSA